MRLVFLFTLLSFSTSVLAGPQLPMSVKDRLRILLWKEGLKEQEVQKTDVKKPLQFELPEELERPLRNL